MEESKKMKPGCLVKFPNGLILPILKETHKGLLFDVKNEEVVLTYDNFNQCEFLGDKGDMIVKQAVLF